MYDAHKILNQYYQEALRLGPAGRQKLAQLRDTNLDRLKQGLGKMGPIQGCSTAVFKKTLDQGSYAMRTLNHHPDGDYDIDTAVIFGERALPSAALDARKRVADAIRQSGGGFIKEPEARLNAVTVWYAEGHHVDLAIYRESNGYLEHAGAQWSKRDPKEVTAWFAAQVEELSPSFFCDVEPKQLRRIVRFVKRFCASRRSWSMPGGMVTSTLVAEVYELHRSRDDVSLRRTLEALSTRLSSDERVYSPIDSSQELTSRPKIAGRVRGLRKRLDEILPKLDALDLTECDEYQARAAWNSVFRHDFFVVKKAKPEKPSSVKVTVGVATTRGGQVRELLYRSSEPPLPKDMWLRFAVVHTLRKGETVRWIVQNEGDEAEAAGDMGHTEEGRELVVWRGTRYRGDHKMRCEIERGGRVVAYANRTVRVA